MNDIEIVSTLNQADWRAYQMAWATRLQSAVGRKPRIKTAITIALCAFIGAIGISFLMRTFNERVPFVAFVLGAALTLVTLIAVQRRTAHRAAPDEHGAVLGHTTLKFDASGIYLQKQAAQARYAWSLVQDVTVTTEHVFVWVDRVSGIIVPMRDLPPGLGVATFTTKLLDWSSAAGIALPPLMPPSAANNAVPHAPAELPAASFSAFARACVRLSTLRTADGDALSIGDRTAAAILFVSLGVLIGIDWLQADAGAEFDFYGVLSLCWYALAALVIAWVGARLSEPQVETRRLVLVAIACLPLVVLLRLCIATWLPEALDTGVLILMSLYLTIIIERALRSITLRGQPRAVAMTMLLTCSVAWVGSHFYLSPQVWYASYEEGADGDVESEGSSYLAQWRSAETTLFEQAERIREAVAALDRPTALRSAGFFVGFAGMGEQRVFAGEIALAERSIASKFGTAPRSIRLVNDRRDFDAYPLASPTSLRYALAAVAERMDIDNDVLFLSLSSHGSKDGMLSVSNVSLPLNDLSATDVAAALAVSGIKWRVIVVSACYSGTFIEPLRNDNTIVITAASADRTSFGCSDDRDLTYFGEAFYRDALPRASNLRSAFDETKKAIAAREQAEGIEPSDPQASFGAAIEAHLAELDRS